MRNLHAQRGQTIPLAAMTLVVLIGVTALSVDAGYDQYQQRQQQNATDSAAIAGARELLTSSSSATAAAKADASINGYADDGNTVKITVDTDYQDSYTGSSPAVQVQIVKNNYPKFFGSIFGGGNVTITTTAVARDAKSGAYCLYQLDPAGLPNFNGMNWNGPNCGMILNGTPNFASGTIDANMIGYAGGTPGENGANFVEATPQPAPPAVDPCQTIPGCAYLANDPPTTNPCEPGTWSGSGNMPPGCYNSVNSSFATITLTGGLYVFTAGANFNKATIQGTGTLYFDNTSCGNFNKDTLEFSAPTTGSTAGVMIYQQPGNASCNPNFNGSTSSSAALVYYPTYTVNYNGSAGAYQILVCGSVNFNGSTQNFPAPPTNNSLIEIPTLTE
jgi:hypothetical protein